MADYECLGLWFDEEECSADDEEPSRFIHEYEGRITLLRDDKDVDIGTFCVIYVDVEGAVAEEDSVFDVFDARQQTMELYEDLYVHDSVDFRPEVIRAACGPDYLWSPNLLVLDRLIIYPEFRGASRGLVALRGLIQRLRPGAGIVVMKPFPLQHEDLMCSPSSRPEREMLKLDAFERDRRKATAALRRYYSKLGFKRVPGTEYMVLDPQRHLVPVAKLLGASEPRRSTRSLANKSNVASQRT